MNEPYDCKCDGCMAVTEDARQRALLRAGDLVLPCGHRDGVRQEAGEMRCHVCRRLVVPRVAL